MNSKSSLVAIVILLLLMPACLSPSLPESNPQWSLGIYTLEENRTDDRFELKVKVTIEGQWGDEIVKDVRVCAKNSSGHVIGRADIGTLSSERPSANATLELADPPRSLMLGYGDIETDQPGYDIIGIERSADGIYSESYQNGSRCS